MYLRHSTVRKDGKTHTYWRLVRSVRRNGKGGKRARRSSGRAGRGGPAPRAATGATDQGTGGPGRSVRASDASPAGPRGSTGPDPPGALASLRGCLAVAHPVARSGPGGVVSAADAARPRGGGLGGHGGGLGAGPTVRAIERAAHRRGLVPDDRP